MAAIATCRAGLIGHTGQGNYGHELDLAALGIPGVELVALADPNEAGRAQAQRRTGAARAYADYREMLEREALDLAIVATRWPDRHEAMVIDAVRSGVKAIYSEKPLARTPDEAGRILAACDERGVKLAVALQNRVAVTTTTAKRWIAEGKIGRLRAIRGYGKQDRRSGGQDLLVLGHHWLDLMRVFAGDARWCHARVTVEGRDAVPADLHPAEENAGPVAGDDVVAQYGFDGGVVATFESTRSEDGGGTPYFRVELCGTKGMIAFWSALREPPALYFYPRPFVLPDRPDEWQVTRLEPLAPPAGVETRLPENQVLVRDLLDAVETGRQPVCSGRDGRAALEMVAAVYESHFRGERVTLPLEKTPC